MDNLLFDEDKLPLTDKLAVERTRHAERSTILAWIRTSLSLIGFGFTIFKALELVVKEGTTVLMRPQTPRNIGLVMILTGTIPLLLGIIQYVRGMKRLGDKTPIFLDPNFLAASAIFLLGAILAVSIVLRASFL